jgi:hypothetical protein
MGGSAPFLRRVGGVLEGGGADTDAKGDASLPTPRAWLLVGRLGEVDDVVGIGGSLGAGFE